MIMTLNLNVNVFNKNWCGCCSFQTIGIVISTIIAISGANPIIRTAQMEGPCNIGDMTGDILEEHRTVNMLIHRAIAVIHLANRTKEVTMSTMLSPDDTPNANFLPEEQFSTTGGQFSIDTVDLALQYKYFYEEIVKLNSYLKEASKFRTPLGDRSIKGDLNNISLEVEKLLCDVFIEYRYQGGDSSVLRTTHELSSAFDIPEADNTLYNQTKRAYVLLNDCVNLMNYFKTIVSNHTSQ